MLLRDVFQLITKNLKPCQFADDSAILKRLISPHTDAIPHEALFELNASVERYIVDQLECSTVTDCPDGQAQFSVVRKKCSAILDLTWESINVGMWSEVPVERRTVYSYHRLLEAMLILIQDRGKATADSLVDALKSIDNGLIMSPDLPGRLLSKVASLIHQHITILLQSPANDNTSAIQIRWNQILQKIHTRKSSQNVTHVTEMLLLKAPVDRTIPRVADIDLLTFERQYFRPSVPIIITGQTDQWPCMSNRRWSLEYILRVAAFRQVPIELGSKYTEESWSQKFMQLIDFIDTHILQTDAEVGYLAQHNLFEQIPELANDFAIPDLCAATARVDANDNDDDEEEDISPSAPVDINAWFGPAGTVSPLHTDEKENLFVQVLGRKYLRLYSSATPAEQIYRHGDRLLATTSAVDLENVDTDRFAAFNHIDPTLIHECILEEGEMLYLPKGWWHFVKSLDVSFSLSFWW